MSARPYDRRAATLYWHAGVETETDGNVRWSASTRRSRKAAEAEAQRMARQGGGRALIEWWDRSAGLRPGDQDVVLGADYIDGL